MGIINIVNLLITKNYTVFIDILYLIYMTHLCIFFFQIVKISTDLKSVLDNFFFSNFYHHFFFATQFFMYIFGGGRFLYEENGCLKLNALWYRPALHDIVLIGKYHYSFWTILCSGVFYQVYPRLFA